MLRSQCATSAGFTVRHAPIYAAIKISEISINLPAYISPGLAFTIWVIASYTYLGILHNYWENNEEFSESSFSYFIFGELAFRFKRPLLLFPGFVLFILLLWISPSTDKLSLGMFLLVIFVFFGIAITSKYAGKETVTQEHKAKIDTDWNFLKERIAQKLAKNQWLTIHDMVEVTDIWEIPSEAMGYAFSKYAFEHPEDVKYSYLYRKEDNKLSYNERVLINLASINEDLYWHSSS